MPGLTERSPRLSTLSSRFGSPSAVTAVVLRRPLRRPTRFESDLCRAATEGASLPLRLWSMKRRRELADRCIRGTVAYRHGRNLPGEQDMAGGCRRLNSLMTYGGWHSSPVEVLGG